MLHYSFSRSTRNNEISGETMDVIHSQSNVVNWHKRFWQNIWHNGQCINSVWQSNKVMEKLSFIHTVCWTIMAVHLGVKMADTLSFTAKMDMVDF